jgi:hypothetical protein
MQKISEMRREPFRFIYRIGTQAWNDELQGLTIDEMKLSSKPRKRSPKFSNVQESGGNRSSVQRKTVLQWNVVISLG